MYNRPISYKRLFHLHVQKDEYIKTSTTCRAPSNIIPRMKHNGYVSLEAFESICHMLNCDIDKSLELITDNGENQLMRGECMGLFSDYLEQCRDRSRAGDLDPCMIIGGNFRRKMSSYHEIYHTLAEYSKSNDEEQKNMLCQQLTERSSELEMIKSGYLLGEKTVLAVWNSGKLQSSMMVDTVKLLLAELRKSYQAICDLRQKINQQLGEKIDVRFSPPSENDIRKNLMKMIGSSIVTYLQDTSVILDTSEFRKVVCDFAEIIRSFEQEQYNQPEKKIVQYHMEKDFGIKNSHFKCVNCGNLLLEDIPYCLNCYERN